MWLRYRINTLRLADLVGDEDLAAKLVGHMRYRDTLGTGGRDWELPDTRVVGKMQVVIISGDDTRCTGVVLCGGQ